MKNIMFYFSVGVSYLFGISIYVFTFVLFIIVPNVMAFVKNEDLSFDLGVLTLHNNFVKFLIICADCLFVYFLYQYAKDWFVNFKNKHK